MGILLVYDVTDETSFNNIRNWMRNIEQHASETVNKILVVGLYKLNAVDPQLESTWFQPLNRKCDLLVSKFAFNLNLCRYVVGNKCDMEDKRVISTARGQALADEFGIPFFETSAKANLKVGRLYKLDLRWFCGTTERS